MLSEKSVFFCLVCNLPTYLAILSGLLFLCIILLFLSRSDFVYDLFEHMLVSELVVEGSWIRASGEHNPRRFLLVSSVASRSTTSLPSPAPDDIDILCCQTLDLVYHQGYHRSDDKKKPGLSVCAVVVNDVHCKASRASCFN